MGIPVRCGDATSINVAPGHYRPEFDDKGNRIDAAVSLLQSNASYINLDVPPVMAVPCPWGEASCKGGKDWGDLSCVEGHHGVFCASCDQGYYRGSDNCRLCPQNAGRAVATTALIIFVGAVGLTLMAIYLRTASTSSTGSHVFLGDCFPTVARTLARMPPSTHRQISATFKIGVGLVQCLSTLRRFSKVRWPETFTAFIEAIDIFLLEAFSVVPAECIAGRRLGFFYELVATLVLPLMTFLVIMLMAALLYGCELSSVRRKKRLELRAQAKVQEEARAQAGGTEVAMPAKRPCAVRHHHEDSLLKMLNRPQVWTLNILAWLLLYPSVTRKALETFDCIELLGRKYLRADPAISCDDEEYYLMACIACVGVLYGCVLAPAMVIWQTSRKHASPERVCRARVALLTYSYQDKYHYWEAVDLTRKLMLTSVVLLVGTDTILQLWFATATGLIFLVLYLALSPYRDQASGRIQLAALVQLEFTYMTAALFFDRKPQAGQGEALVVINCVVVLVLLVTALRSIGRMGVELRELQLTFVDDKTVVQLPMLNDEFATHLCEIACVQHVTLFPFPIPAVVLTPPLRRQVRLVPLGERTGSMRRAQEPAAIDTSHLQNLC
jgi:hypothetical protein